MSLESGMILKAVGHLLRLPDPGRGGYTAARSFVTGVLTE
jgi:hypothetical protein